MQRAERFLLEAYAFRGGLRANRRRDGPAVDIAEAGLAEGFLQHAGAAEAEGAGLSRQRRRQIGATADNRNRNREELVVLGCAVDDGRDAAARLQRTFHAGQGLLLVREVDQTDARDDRVERAFRYVQLLAVQHLGLDIAKPGIACIRFGEGQDVRRNVGGQHTAGGSDARRGLQRLVARASRHVEYPVARFDRGHVEHDLGCRPEPGTQQRTPVVPGLGGGLPLLAGGFLILDGIERFCSGCRCHGDVSLSFGC